MKITRSFQGTMIRCIKSFAFFYMFVGISSALIFFLEFFPSIYTEAMSFIRSILPFSLIGAYFFLRQRVRSNKFSPKMMADDG